MRIVYLDETYLDEGVALMAKYNKEKRYKIGYCSLKPNSIRKDLIESFEDEENKTIGVIEQGKLIGIIDLQVDLEKQVIEMIGPFIDREEENEWLSIANEMCQFIFEALGFTYKYLFFIHQENQINKKLLKNLGATSRGHEYVLELKKENVKVQLLSKRIVEASQNVYEEFQAFHDTLWPGVYYSGKQIIEKLTRGYQLFIAKNNQELEGYVFVQKQLEAESGYIHFLAVKEGYRKQGIGKALLTKAIEYLFKESQIKKISLCVEVLNEVAMQLYFDVGFEVENTYTAYQIQNKE